MDERSPGFRSGHGYARGRRLRADRPRHRVARQRRAAGDAGLIPASGGRSGHRAVAGPLKRREPATASPHPGATRRTRIAPRAVAGSTTRPPWVTSTSPDATSRRAAARAGSISARQSSPPTARAASDGQIVATSARCSSSARIAQASRWSTDASFELDKAHDNLSELAKFRRWRSIRRSSERAGRDDSAPEAAAVRRSADARAAPRGDWSNG